MTKARFIELAEYPVSLSCQREKRKKRFEKERERRDKRETDEQREGNICIHIYARISIYVSAVDPLS